MYKSKLLLYLSFLSLSNSRLRSPLVSPPDLQTWPLVPRCAPSVTRRPGFLHAPSLFYYCIHTLYFDKLIVFLSILPRCSVSLSHCTLFSISSIITMALIISFHRNCGYFSSCSHSTLSCVNIVSLTLQLCGVGRDILLSRTWGVCTLFTLPSPISLALTLVIIPHALLHSSSTRRDPRRCTSRTPSTFVDLPSMHWSSPFDHCTCPPSTDRAVPPG
jgi:hypothetical protein